VCGAFPPAHGASTLRKFKISPARNLAKYLLASANVRFALWESGHRATQSLCPFRANRRNLRVGAAKKLRHLQAKRTTPRTTSTSAGRWVRVYQRPKRFARSFSKCDGGSVLAAAMSVATNMSCGSDAVAPKYFWCTSLGTLIRIFVLGALP
jgi:hypothetical protein